MTLGVVLDTRDGVHTVQWGSGEISVGEVEMTMSYLIYVVMGQTGEYSDHMEWPVAAYRAEKVAAERVMTLERMLKEFEEKVRRERDEDWVDEDAITELMQEHDPEFSYSYGRTRYYFSGVELR